MQEGNTEIYLKKKKKQKSGRNRYNMSHEKKQKLKVYQKNYYKANKTRKS